MTPTAVAPQSPTPTAVLAAYARAFERAQSEVIEVVRQADTTWLVTGKGYIVAQTGGRWFQLSCTCAGGNHPACKHRALVVAAIKYGFLRLKTRGVAAAAVVAKPAPVAVPVVAPVVSIATERRARVAAQIAAERVSGQDPLQVMFG